MWLLRRMGGVLIIMLSSEEVAKLLGLGPGMSIGMDMGTFV